MGWLGQRRWCQLQGIAVADILLLELLLCILPRLGLAAWPRDTAQRWPSRSLIIMWSLWPGFVP